MRPRKPKNTPQWQHVRDARTRLANSANFPVLDSLEEAWESLEALYGYTSLGGQRRKLMDRDDIEQVSEHPLTSLMFMVETGFYPPPELLLGLLESWHEYLDGHGDKSLEEAFLGKPSRKGGNYAMRQVNELKNMWLSFELDKLVASGMTQEQAAEAITNRYPLKIEADSLVRIARKNRIFPTKRTRKRTQS